MIRRPERCSVRAISEGPHFLSFFRENQFCVKLQGSSSWETESWSSPWAIKIRTISECLFSTKLHTSNVFGLGFFNSTKTVVMRFDYDAWLQPSQVSPLSLNNVCFGAYIVLGIRTYLLTCLVGFYIWLVQTWNIKTDDFILQRWDRSCNKILTACRKSGVVNKLSYREWSVGENMLAKPQSRIQTTLIIILCEKIYSIQ